MIDLNTYIIEKLKIDNDSSLKYGFQKGDPITYIWVEDMEDEDTNEVISIFRILANALIFEKFENNTIYYKNGKYNDIDSMSAELNSNGFLQRNTGIFLSLEDTKDFCNKILKDDKNFINNGIYNFFELKKGAFDNVSWADEWFKKTLRMVNAKLGRIHNRKA